MTQVFNIDCMVAMKEFPDKYFELAIVDPPYGLGDKLLIGGKNGHLKFSQQYQDAKWRDVVPDQSYFIELFRVSRNQIIWGANYFDLRTYRCPIVWDKLQPVDNFSAIELAWSSFDEPSKIFKLRQAGFIGQPKIHPTQKPVALYKWLLKNYAKEGDKILDTHLGSGSSRIAADQMGFDFWGYELDKDYFDASVKRFNQYKSQLTIFPI